MNKFGLGRWLLIVGILVCIVQGTWQHVATEDQLPSADKSIKFIPKYFKMGTDSEVVLSARTFLDKLKLKKNPCIYDVAMNSPLWTNNFTVYWNRTAILLKHSSLMNYTNEYTIKLLVHYKLSCNSSVGYEESENTTVTVKLRPLDIHLVWPGKLVEGQPLQLTCKISGHTPTDIHKVKINYWSRSSGDPIANCSNDEATHKLPESDIDHDVLTSTCKLSTHSTQSNSGDYYCTATIEHMEVSSEDIAVNVEPRIHWKTITSAAVGSAGLIVLVSSLLLAIVIRKSYVKCKHRPGVPPEEEIADENVHLLHNDRDGIRENNIIPNFNQYQALGVDDHRNIEANLDRREGGRDSPADSDRSQPGGHDSLVLPDQGGYESNV